MDITRKIILIIILVFLIILSGLFSASETALMALSKSKIKMKKMQDSNIKGFDELKNLIDDSNKLLSTILIGNNIVNIGASSIATSLFMDMFGVTGVPIATAIMTITVLIFGEITPKTIATHYPEKVSLFVLRIILISTCVFKPLVHLLDKLSVLIFKIFKIDMDNQDDQITEEAIKALVDVSHEEGVIEEDERTIIHNVFDFSGMKAKEAMVNRTNVIGIDRELSYNDITKLFEEEKFTRMPVYEESLDTIVGILNFKDIAFLSDEEKKSFDITNYIREPFFTYEFKDISDLLEDMKNEKHQMAIVVDEYGGTSGLLTLENLIEEIVGDIEDEYDNEDEDDISKLNENEFLIDGSVYLSDVNEATGLNLESDNFDSIGGYIIDYLNGFPEQGQIIVINEVKYIIEDVDKIKINKVKIKLNT